MTVIKDIASAIEDITYQSYKYNRLNSPTVSPERWETIYRNAAELEVRFQTERAKESKESMAGYYKWLASAHWLRIDNRTGGNDAN